MKTLTITANGKQIEAAMASAVSQTKLISLMNSRLAMAFNLANQIEAKVDVKNVTMMLAALETEIKDQVTEILTEKAFIVGTKIRVSVKDFQGAMLEWHSFLAKLLIWNLADFFDLYATENQNALAVQVLEAAGVTIPKAE